MAGFWGVVVGPLAVTALAWAAWLVLFAVGCFVMSSILVIGWSFHEDPEGAAHEAQKQLGLETPALAELGEKRSAELPAGAAAQGGRSAKYKAKGANPPAAAA